MTEVGELKPLATNDKPSKPVPSFVRPERTASFRELTTALASAQKSGNGAPAYSRYVNRPAGRVLAAIAFRLGLTPNAVTGISALFSFTGIAMIVLIRPTWWSGLLIGLSLMLGYAFDSADGQLARLRGGGSAVGEWLDHMVDAAKISCLHLAVLVGLFRFSDLAAGWLLVPIAYAAVAAVMFFGMILIDQLRRRSSASSQAMSKAGPSSVRSILVIPTDYGLLCVVFLLCGYPQLFMWIYLVLLVANAGFLVLASRKWFNEMQIASFGESA